ncbi:hypothetical protein [Actinoplanes derwentensis]|uniref:Uncharacterized protein n=1 Tax=Actinoplanes derwentensis TaxID=113562 RepID=A0A1H2A4K0_9ACTN|nr:hypothetical protein [Actinoplanes derwentensis]GID83383.1 hypothetical protein Ade03nite_23070 [Actinoplanes derwentensis]SDT40797.1 hypothetical protein SAMN04489716_3657 [Actinoplanes derwentensis]
MASITQRIQAFLNSPKGRQLAEQGRRQLAKPENQQKLKGLLAKFQGRGSRR